VIANRNGLRSEIPSWVTAQKCSAWILHTKNPHFWSWGRGFKSLALGWDAIVSGDLVLTFVGRVNRVK
jgi:hypothetical protein